MTLLVPAALASIVAHEAGHAAVALLLGHRVTVFARFPVAVGVGVWAPDEGLPRLDDALIAVAGPSASVTLGTLALAGGAFDPATLSTLVGILSLVVGTLSLVPLGPSDGRRIWRARP